MKRFLLITLLVSITTINGQELRLASDIWPPFTNTQNEKSVASDLVLEALGRNSIEAQLYIKDFENVLNGINANTYQGSAALWKTSEREKTLFFSKPYLQNQLVLIGRKGSDVEIYSAKELGEAKIGLVKNYAYSEELMTANNLIKVFSSNDQENLEKLIDEQIDYMLVDALLIQYLMKYQMNDVQQLLSIAKKPFEVKPLYFALRKDYPNAEKIIAQFNKEIDAMITDGTYHKILELNWVKADINGDGIAELYLSGDAAGELPPQQSYALDMDVSNNMKSFYYIEGKMYEDWESVPEHYKKKGRLQSSETENKGGFTLRL